MGDEGREMQKKKKKEQKKRVWYLQKWNGEWPLEKREKKELE